jgi:hypothetical protein
MTSSVQSRQSADGLASPNPTIAAYDNKARIKGTPPRC